MMKPENAGDLHGILGWLGISPLNLEPIDSTKHCGSAKQRAPSAVRTLVFTTSIYYPH